MESNLLKPETSDSRETVLAKTRAKAMVQTLEGLADVMCEWQQAVRIMLRAKIPG